jgi:glutamate-1-semialdehyde 2,1-aminomutase
MPRNELLAWDEDAMSTMTLRRALKSVPGGSSTEAKSCYHLFPPATPVFAVSAEGCHFKDELGRVWLDCDMALGAIVWGHCRAEIDEAVRQQLAKGVLFSLPASLEIEVAERILHRLSVFDALRFCKSGSDAVSAAARVARSATGRCIVIYGTYHGWHDWAAFHWYGCDAEIGIPHEQAATVRWMKEQSYKGFAQQVAKEEPPAAVVVCPEHWCIPDLHQLRDQCSQWGSILVFDEVKAGLRFGKRGVFATIGVIPDLLCLSKGLANGLPLAVLAGRRDLMQHCTSAHVTGTHAGECLSLAAAGAAERLLDETEVWPPWESAAHGIMAAADRAIVECGLLGRLVVDGYPGCFRIGTPDIPVDRDSFRRHFVCTLAAEGIFSAGYVLPSAAHQMEDYSAIKRAVLGAIRSWATLNS